MLEQNFAAEFSVLGKMAMPGGTENDRTVAIITAAYIENHVEPVLERYFPCLDKDLSQQFFSPSNGLARTLWNKLDLARALNAITEPMYCNAKLIARIRNKFAHDLMVDNFDHSGVRDLVDNISHGYGDVEFNSYSRSDRYRLAALSICGMFMSLHIERFPFSFTSGESAFGTGERPPWLDTLSEPPRETR